MKKTVILVTGLMALLVYSCGTMGASSGDTTSKAENMIKKSDKNGDGKIDINEIKWPLTADNFSQYDTNSDGFLDKMEVAEILKKM